MEIGLDLLDFSDFSAPVLEADDVEFDISDDVPAVREFLSEGHVYDPYKIMPKNNCGNNFMGWG